MPLVFGRSILGFAVADTGVTWTNPDLTTASYDSVSFSVTNEESLPRGIAFKTDGTKLYVVGLSGDDINEYNLSTAWDISTASINQTFDFSTNTTNPWGVFINEDGTKLFVVDNPNDSVDSYDFGTAWDISTLVYNTTFSVASQATTPYGLTFKPDGTKMYVSNYNTGVYEYNLSTGFDLSTASYNQFGAKDSGQTSQISGISFSPNGDKAWIVDFGNDDIDEYDLSTAWDISTLSYSKSFSVASQDTLPTFAIFKTDGSKMYVIGSATDTVYQYSTVAPAWSADLSSASYDNVSFSVASQDNTSPLGLAFNNNGTKMYFLGGSADTIYQYSLSTAFDVSTASYDSVSFSVQTQDTNSFNLTFNNNGTKMYTVGATGDSVYQYSLSTSFDLSTASYDSVSFSVASQDITPYDVAFGSSGTKMYIVGFNNDTLYQYSLSTAYDLSTASYDSVSFSVATQEIQPTDFAISSDGTEIYVVGLANDTVYKYTLSTAWDLSTAAYSNVSFSVASQETLPRSVTFNSSGSKMYILGSTNKSVFQYST
jgi:DNA-binding beta-propeller fold protein YncE